MPKCDYFKGKWVYDNESYPLYKEKECSFMSDQLACHKFGRQDLSYQFWKWQPHHCDLPRLNATTLLEALRNKRLVFVGDSINRGQWTSMVCLVEQAIPNTSLKIMETNGSLFTFKAIEYNASIDFYWAPLLVESNSDHPGTSGLQERIVRTQAIEKHARHWDDAHILVFDSYLWWRRETMKVLWGSFEEEDGIYKEIEMLKGYEMALRTWSDWLEIHVNHSNSRIFWMTPSPMHGSAEYWGGESGSNCYNETQPIAKQLYPDESGGLEQKMMQLVEAETNSLITKGVNIQVVDITLLSKYRKEAHPSIHRRQWQPLTKDQLKNPTSYADCFHWCLPGVPDIWNQILYAYLFI
ncbi:protein trichome birefringence-like 34 [Silene latifolia]